MIAAALLSLSLIQSVPSPESTPAISPQTQSIIQAAANFCGQIFSTDMDLQICMEAQRQAFEDIRNTVLLNLRMNDVDMTPIVQYCVAEEFIGPDVIDIPRVRECVVTVIAKGNV